MPAENWENDVETRIKELEATVSHKDEMLATQTKVIETLKATVDTLKAAEQAREEAAAGAYAEDIAAKATEAGAPIEEGKLERVRALYAENPELARELGSTYLELAQATGGGAVGGSDPKRVSLSTGPASPEAQTQGSLERFQERWGNRLSTLQQGA